MVINTWLPLNWHQTHTNIVVTVTTKSGWLSLINLMSVETKEITDKRGWMLMKHVEQRTEVKGREV